jgi:ribosomal protein L35AE/L33A
MILLKNWDEEVLVSEAVLVKIKEILLERGQAAIYMGRRIFYGDSRN